MLLRIIIIIIIIIIIFILSLNSNNNASFVRMNDVIIRFAMGEFTTQFSYQIKSIIQTLFNSLIFMWCLDVSLNIAILSALIEIRWEKAWLNQSVSSTIVFNFGAHILFNKIPKLNQNLLRVKRTQTSLRKLTFAPSNGSDEELEVVSNWSQFRQNYCKNIQCAHYLWESSVFVVRKWCICDKKRLWLVQHTLISEKHTPGGSPSLWSAQAFDQSDAAWYPTQYWFYPMNSNADVTGNKVQRGKRSFVLVLHNYFENPNRIIWLHFSEP